MRRTLLVILPVVGILFALSPLAVGTAHAATNTKQVITHTSTNWGGYSINFTNTQATPLSVSGAWTVPSVSCKRNGSSISGQVAVWDGLGGVNAGNNLEQIGTDSQCISGKVKYWAWYEFPPANPYPIMKDGNYPISPGDAMRADVTDQGSGYFVLRIFDDTKGWYYVKIWINQNASATPQTGEWIVEDPGNQTFPQFYNVVFTNCYWVQNGPQEDLSIGSNLTQYTIIQANFPYKQKETTLDIFPDDTDFAVYWNHF